MNLGEVTKEEAELILSGLAELPLKLSAPLYARLRAVYDEANKPKEDESAEK